MRVEYTKSEPQRLQLYGSLYLLYHLQQTLKRIKHTLSFFGRALNAMEVSQFNLPGDMYLYIWPVKKAEGLDSLRSTVGMNPISEYLQQLTEVTGINAQYVPQLTVTEINIMRTGE